MFYFIHLTEKLKYNPHCSYTVLDITYKALYTLINVSLQHVQPAQADPGENSIKEKEKPTVKIPEEKRIIPQLNTTKVHQDSQRGNESSYNSNSSVITPKDKDSKNSSTERWYTVKAWEE